MSAEPNIAARPDLVSNMSRMLAAYKLRLALRAKQMGAQAAIWEGKAISIDEERRLLLSEDESRIAPRPYPGLRSFDTEEGEIFFGRDKNIEEVQALLARNRVIAVLGSSGSGKSSLLRAGLLPFLNTEGRITGQVGNWYKTEFRPRTRPLYELSSALAEQLMLPLLRLKKPGLADEMKLPPTIDASADEAASWLRDVTHRQFTEANGQGREAVLHALLKIVEEQLDSWDNLATGGRRLSGPSLFLFIDQLEEAFRPEVPSDERKALLNLIVDLHSYVSSQKSGSFLALTMRSQELHRCAEYRGLSEIVVGCGYQLDLLDPANETDRAKLRFAIVQPARTVFEDWGLGEWVNDHPDAPFSPGMPDLLLDGAARLSKELEHRPDQLPLLQHALQATWDAAMRRWSRDVSNRQARNIAAIDLPGYEKGTEVPDLGASLNTNADLVASQATQRFAEIVSSKPESGEQGLRAAFRALARRHDNNWARRIAGEQEINVFLEGDADFSVAAMPKDLRWKALQEALKIFLVSGYLNGGGNRGYDISHEALIRNWRRFQLWLRDPEEVANCLARVLLEMEEPEAFAGRTDDEKIGLIPQDVARKLAMVSTAGPLSTSWGEDQIAPLLQRSNVGERWGTSKSKAFQKVAQLSRLANEAWERTCFRKVEFSVLPSRPVQITTVKNLEQKEKSSLGKNSSRETALDLHYYVSYAWADLSNLNREKDVDRLCDEARERGIEVIRDKNSLRDGDLISTFMRRIGEGDRIFIFLSDKYLKSSYCMIELFEIWRNNRENREEFRRRVRFIAIDDTKIETPDVWLAYTKYWKEQRDSLQRLIDEVGWKDAGQEVQKRFDQLTTFAGKVSDILALFADTVQPRNLEDLLKYGFADQSEKISRPYSTDS
jgi:TIR domain